MTHCRERKPEAPSLPIPVYDLSFLMKNGVPQCSSTFSGWVKVKEAWEEWVPESVQWGWGSPCPSRD